MKTKKLDLLPLKALKVNDFFWNKYTGLVTKEIIPYQWKALNDEVLTISRLPPDSKKELSTDGYFRIQI